MADKDLTKDGEQRNFNDDDCVEAEVVYDGNSKTDGANGNNGRTRPGYSGRVFTYNGRQVNLFSLKIAFTSFIVGVLAVLVSLPLIGSIIGIIIGLPLLLFGLFLLYFSIMVFVFIIMTNFFRKTP